MEEIVNLNRIEEQTEYVCNSLLERLERLRRVNNMLFGEVPVGKTDSNVRTAPAGMLGNVTSGLQTAADIISDLTHELHRLESIGNQQIIEDNYICNDLLKSSIG